MVFELIEKLNKLDKAISQYHNSNASQKDKINWYNQLATKINILSTLSDAGSDVENFANRLKKKLEKLKTYGC